MNLQHYQWLISLPSLLVIATIGMVTHFLKKSITGETLGDIKTFFTNHVRSTLVAFIATMVGTLGVYFSLMPAQITQESMALVIIAAFGCGYTFDSFFNKWDKPQ